MTTVLVAQPVRINISKLKLIIVIEVFIFTPLLLLDDNQAKKVYRGIICPGINK